MKLLASISMLVLFGFVMGLAGGIKYESDRVKSFEEISQMIERTADSQRQKLENLQNLTAAERKKLNDAARQILKKYLPEEPQKQENQKTEGGEVK